MILIYLTAVLVLMMCSGNAPVPFFSSVCPALANSKVMCFAIDSKQVGCRADTQQRLARRPDRTWLASPAAARGSVGSRFLGPTYAAKDPAVNQK